MVIELPYNAKVIIETKKYSYHLETIVEIEDNGEEGDDAILKAYNLGDNNAKLETIYEFFDLHEDQLQDWLASKGYIFNKA